MISKGEKHKNNAFVTSFQRYSQKLWLHAVEFHLKYNWILELPAIPKVKVQMPKVRCILVFFHIWNSYHFVPILSHVAQKVLEASTSATAYILMTQLELFHQ